MAGTTVLPPFESRGAAATAMAMEFPTHGEQIRVATPSLEALSQELLDKRAKYRQLALEIAGLECQLKSKIGLFRGLRTKKGTWFWETVPPRARTNWSEMCKALSITKRMRNLFSTQGPPTRLLRFSRNPPPSQSS